MEKAATGTQMVKKPGPQRQLCSTIALLTFEAT